MRKLGLLALFLAAACGRPSPAPSPGLSPCAPHTSPLAGACVPEEQMQHFCGAAAHPSAGGCLPASCDAGPIDLSTGDCVPALTLEAIAKEVHADLADGGKLGCADGVLSVDKDQAACIPRASACGRGSTWADAACTPDLACPKGSIAAPDAGCAPAFRAERARAVLDVGAWIRLALGPDGGPGTDAVCGAIRMRPWRAGAAEHGRVTVDVDVRLVFPDNDVGSVRAQAVAHKEGEPTTEGASAWDEGRELQPLWEALRSLGGVSSAASASVTVRCMVESLGAPLRLLPDGGAGKRAKEAGSAGKPKG